MNRRILVSASLIAILVLASQAAALAAPALDEIVGFFSDAPYVEYLPGVAEGAGLDLQTFSGAAAGLLR
jgi:hypothetical protein